MMMETTRAAIQRLSFLLILFALLAAPNVFAGGDPPRDPIISRQALVRLAPGGDVNAFNQQYGSTTLDSIASRNIHLLRIPDAAFNEDTWVAEVLATNPLGLFWLEPNYDGQDGEGRTGSFYVSSINGQNFYNTQYPRSRIRLPGAHEITRGGGIVVAVLDTGIDSTHPLLTSRIVAGGYNFVEGNANTEDVADGVDEDNDGTTDESFGHGTFMAGLIAMVAPDAQLLPIKVLNSDGHGSGFHIAAGMFHAIDQGADVINLSMGSTYDAEAVSDALKEARAAGIAVIAAAGNRDVDDPEEHPATVENFCIGVAATGQDDRKSPFSNYHRKLAMCAPGSDGIYSTIPINAQGHRYARWEGTSLSTAMTSGTVALIYAAHPEWPEATRAVAARAALQAAADPIDDSYYNDGEMGAGRLDARGAVTVTAAPVTVITDAQVAFGSYISGVVGDLIDIAEDEPEEVHYRARSQFGFLSSEPNRLDIVFGFATNHTSPASANIRLKSRINNPGGTLRIRLRRWSNSSLVQIVQAPIGTSFSVLNVPVSNIAPFIRSSDGRIEMNMKEIVVATFSTSGFVATVDELSVQVQ
ncbi:MAG: S8 family serine peptidase [Phycisphaerales bacterium]